MGAMPGTWCRLERMVNRIARIGAVIVGAIVAAAIIFTIALLVNTLLELGAVVSLYIHSHASRETEQHKQPL